MSAPTVSLRFAITIALTIASATLHGAPTAGALWTDSFDQAKKTAAAGKQDLLMDFTGSDWCSWCIKLRKEVFDQAAFKAAAPKDFVLVELDYPQDDSKLSAEVKAQNGRLQKEFAIRGYPTIVLADSSGRPYAETGYQEGGPETYLTHLHELRKIKATRDQAFAKAESATGVERALQLAAGLKAMDETLVATHYRPVLDEIAKLDPTDRADLGSIRFKGDLAGLQEKLSFAAKSGGSAAVRTPVDEFIAAHPKITAEQRQGTLMGLLNFYRPPQDNDTVLKLMDEVKSLKADSQLGQQAAAISDRVQKMTTEAKGNAKPAAEAK